MNILAVDDEQLALRGMEAILKTLCPQDSLSCFDAAEDAIAYAKRVRIDVAFLDIEMGGISGISLAEQLVALYDRTNIIFITGHSHYALPAYSVAPSGYLMKPVGAKAVEKEISRLRYPVAQEKRDIRVQTFGNFEIFVDGKPLPFSRTKSKELLAYLVDRNGAGLARRELAGIVFAGQAYSRALQTHLQILIAELSRSLKKAGIDDLLIRQHGSYALDTSLVQCDYYSFLRHDPKAVAAFSGEYMTNYPWAEATRAALRERKHALLKRP